MNCLTILPDEMYDLIGEEHNPPVIRNEDDEAGFEAEIRSLYQQLVETLSEFGDEGDYYGVSDFAVRPDLKIRPSVIGPVPHVRQFTITILTEAFYRSRYLETLVRFCERHAPNYRVVVDTDFDPDLILRIFLTGRSAKLCCSDQREANRLFAILEKS